MTCARTQGFLARRGITVKARVDARKAPIQGEAALGVRRGAGEIYVAKGRQVVRVDLEHEKPDRATLLGLLLGPTGRLRAPTIRTGRTLIVGFDEATYRKVLG
jgi:hypothetical protein